MLSQQNTLNVYEEGVGFIPFVLLLCCAIFFHHLFLFCFSCARIVFFLYILWIKRQLGLDDLNIEDLLANFSS